MYLHKRKDLNKTLERRRCQTEAIARSRILTRTGEDEASEEK